MNLTFYKNSNEKENSFLYSNYNFYNYNKHQKIRLFPSIFSNFETETKENEEISPKKKKNTIKLPYYRNIKEEIIKTKNNITALFNIKNTIFKQMRTKANSLCYQNFIKGFAKSFFGPFGIVTKRNKYLKEFYLKKSTLNDRIYAGKLSYYDFNNYKDLNQVTARENENKKQRLSLSTNLAVVFGKNDVYSVKAVTSKRLINLKKNFVNINKSKYLNKKNKNNDNNENNNSLEPINEILNISKNNKNKLSQRKKNKLRLSTYNFRKSDIENKSKRKTFSFITEENINNKRKHRSTLPKIKKNSYINIKFNNIKKVNRRSCFFLTQNNFKGKI